VTFMWVPHSEEKAGVVACGLPIKYDASKEFKNKKVILTAAPGAFTPTCQEKHLVSYLEDWPKLKAKGVDNVIFISANDQWVMSAWGKANGVKGNDSILFMSDEGLPFSSSIGWTNGTKPLRYVIVVDHGKIVHAGYDVPRSVEVTGASGVLAHL